MPVSKISHPVPSSYCKKMMNYSEALILEDENNQPCPSHVFGALAWGDEPALPKLQRYVNALSCSPHQRSVEVASSRKMNYAEALILEDLKGHSSFDIEMLSWADERIAKCKEFAKSLWCSPDTDSFHDDSRHVHDGETVSVTRSLDVSKRRKLDYVGSGKLTYAEALVLEDLNQNSGFGIEMLSWADEPVLAKYKEFFRSLWGSPVEGNFHDDARHVHEGEKASVSRPGELLCNRSKLSL